MLGIQRLSPSIITSLLFRGLIDYQAFDPWKSCTEVRLNVGFR